jgi:vancomycin permeability regulator SanA
MLFWFLLPLKRFYKIMLCSVLVFVMPFFAILLYSIDLKTPTNVPIAMILGAGIRGDSPTKILQLRLDKGIELYNQNKIKYIIVSGDNSQESHNEPTVMKNYLISKGIPKNVIVEDFGGRRTMDSCYRIKNYFKVDQVILVSQTFHLNRAKFLCDSVGLNSYVAPAQNSDMSTTFWGYVREVPAGWSAIRDSVYFRPQVGSDGSEILSFNQSQN